MGCGKKQHAESLAQAHEAKILKNLLQYSSQPSVGQVDLETTQTVSTTLRLEQPVLDDEIVSECDWDGNVNHCLSSDSDSDWDNELEDGFESDNSEFSELEGEDLKESLQKALEAELTLLAWLMPYEVIQQATTSKEWKTAEQNRGLGYYGLSDQTQCCHEKKVRDKENKDKELHKM